jgi:hypothetical protein
MLLLATALFVYRKDKKVFFKVQFSCKIGTGERIVGDVYCESASPIGALQQAIKHWDPPVAILEINRITILELKAAKKK